MTDAFIYDAVRTPRGKGKKDGALHSVKPVNLMAGLLRAVQRRNDLDTAQVDDIVLGCVTPVVGWLPAPRYGPAERLATQWRTLRSARHPRRRPPFRTLA